MSPWIISKAVRRFEQKGLRGNSYDIDWRSRFFPQTALKYYWEVRGREMGSVLTQACRKCLKQSTWTSAATFETRDNCSIRNIVEPFTVPPGYAFDDSTWICGHCHTANRYVCIYPKRECLYCHTTVPKGKTQCETCGAPLVLKTIQLEQIIFLETESEKESAKKKHWV